MVVPRRLVRNRPAVLVDRHLKAEAQHLLNRWANFPSSTNPCLIKPDSDSFRSSHSLDSFQDSPDLRAVPHLARSVKAEVTGYNPDRNQARSRFRLVPVVMVDRDRSLARSPSPLGNRVMEDKVVRHRLLDPNQSVAAAMIMVRTEA